MTDTSLKYFKRRAEEEKRHAVESPSQEAAEAHRQMARHYEDRVSGRKDGALNWASE